MAFRGPAAVPVFRNAAEEVIRLAAGLLSPPASGDAVLAIPLPFAPAVPAFKNGDGVLPTTGGVAVREIGGVGRLTVGLSQDEKKSSSAGSPDGVEVPSVETLDMTSVITTSFGYLLQFSYIPTLKGGYIYSWASLFERLFSSSLYFVATFEAYLVLGSLLLSAAVPPFDWKNLVADSLPPTFIIRN